MQDAKTLAADRNKYNRYRYTGKPKNHSTQQSFSAKTTQMTENKNTLQLKTISEAAIYFLAAKNLTEDQQHTPTAPQKPKPLPQKIIFWVPI